MTSNCGEVRRPRPRGPSLRWRYSCSRDPIVHGVIEAFSQPVGDIERETDRKRVLELLMRRSRLECRADVIHFQFVVVRQLAQIRHAFARNRKDTGGHARKRPRSELRTQDAHEPADTVGRGLHRFRDREAR